MTTLIERLHEAIAHAQQTTLVDGDRSHVVLAFSPSRVDADVWAALQEDARRDGTLSDLLEDLWDEQVAGTAEDTTSTPPVVNGLAPGFDESTDSPAPVVLLAGSRPTPSGLSEGLWREPQLRALEEQARDLVAQRLTGRPLDPLHAVKAGARWAQSAVEGPLTMIASTLGRKVGRAAQTAPDRARAAWKDFLRDVDRDR